MHLGLLSTHSPADSSSMGGVFERQDQVQGRFARRSSTPNRHPTRQTQPTRWRRVRMTLSCKHFVAHRTTAESLPQDAGSGRGRTAQGREWEGKGREAGAESMRILSRKSGTTAVPTNQSVAHVVFEHPPNSAYGMSSLSSLDEKKGGGGHSNPELLSSFTRCDPHSLASVRSTTQYCQAPLASSGGQSAILVLTSAILAPGMLPPRKETMARCSEWV